MYKTVVTFGELEKNPKRSVRAKFVLVIPYCRSRTKLYAIYQLYEFTDQIY